MVIRFGSSFGDEVLPDLAQALKLITTNLTVGVLVTVGVLQAEHGEQLVGGGSVN